ncbi:MAG TPA: DinB family protein [Acidobacteriaceae bacterium]|nr:DinB family protein [Acidobacteriaceae bacterium]
MSACSMMTARAQMGAKAPAVAPGTAVEPSKALDDLLKLFEDEVVGVAKAMPADKYSFAPAAATFAAGSPAKFDTVRTFSQEVTHVALANYYFYSSVGGMKPDVDMAALQKMTTDPNVSKEEALKMLTGSLAFAHKAIATITPANAFLAIKPIDGQNTRATLAAFGVAHGYDHYGQMVEYLRMNGIVPPGSK